MSLEPERPEHPEEREQRRTRVYEAKWVGTWWAPILVTISILVWSFLIWGLIRDRERTWQYGTVPYVPGYTWYTSEPVPERFQVPEQIRLPERTPDTGGTTSETR